MTSNVRLNVTRFRVNANSLGPFWTICLWLFASTSMSAQTSAQHDQQALKIIEQTVVAGGGQELITSVQDFTETGTVTYGWGDQPTGNVTVKGRGLHQFKIEADLSAGKLTTVVARDGGLLTEMNGWTRPILRQSANDIGSLTLPLLSLIAAIQDSSASIVYGGLVAHDGASAYDIRLQEVYTQQQDPGGNRGVREARDFYIDPKTFLITAISDRVYFGGPSDTGVSHENLFSNYQPENGIMMPLTVVETVQGETGFTMTFSQVTFNSGLADSDFAW